MGSERFKIHEKGVKNKQGAGDHIVTIRYQYPKKISRKVREALEKLIYNILFNNDYLSIP